MSSFPISITWQVATPPTGQFTQLASAVTGLDKTLLSTSQKFDAFGQTVTKLDAPLGSVGTNMGALSNNFSALDSSLGTSASNMQGFADATGQLDSSIQGVGPALGDMSTAFEDTSTSSQDAIGGITQFGDGVSDMSSRVEGANPPIEQMNSVLTEAGPIFSGAGTATTEFSGALTELNTENQAVAGGLTDSNTLVENLGATTEETSGKTEGFKSNLALLSTGIAGTVSSGISLFNSLTSVRDAQTKADAAALKLEKAMTSLDSKMAALGKTTQTMNSDQSLMISGMDAWNAAMSELTGLIDAGVTSGAEWDAAMKNAQAAQQGLNSTTIEGNKIIGEAGTELTKMGQQASAAAIASQKNQKAQEGVGKAIAALIPDIVTFSSITGNLAATLNGSKGLVKGFQELNKTHPTLAAGLGNIGKAGLLAVIAMEALNIALQALSPGSDTMVLKFEDTKAAVEGVNEAMRNAISTIPGLGPIIANVNKGLEEQINALFGVTDNTKKDAEAKGALGSEMGGIIPAIDTLYKSLNSEGQATVEAAEGTKLLSSQFTDLGNGTGVVVNGVTHAEGSFTRLADGSIVLGGTLDDTSGALDESGQTAEEASTHIDTYDQALEKARQELAESGAEAENTHQKNLGLLELWGVKYPQALRANEGAIQGLVDGYRQQQTATADVVAEATAYIQAHGDITNVTDTSANGIIAYAETLGFESDASKEATVASADFTAQLAKGKEELDAAGQATYELTKAVAEGGAETVKETDARREQAIALGVYDDMVKLAIKDQQPFLDKQQQLQDAEKKEVETLQDLAEKRGMANAEMITSKQVLQDYITTHERLPPTQKEVLQGYQELVVAKQDETFETEKSRLALAKYIEEQLGVKTAANATIGELKALRETLERIGSAHETARTKIADMVGEMIAGREEAEAYRQELGDFFGELTGGNEAIGQSADTIEMWIGVILGAPDALKELNQQLDETWGKISEGGEKIDKLRMDMLEAGEGIKGDMDEKFQEISELFDEFNQSIAEGEGPHDFRENFRENMEDAADDADISVGEIERIIGTDFMNALNDPNISDAEIMQMWAQIEPKARQALEGASGLLTTFSQDTVSTLREFAPKIGEILASGIEAGKNPVQELRGLFQQLPAGVRDDLAGVTAAMQLAGDDWSAAVIAAMSTMKGSMSPEEWASIGEPMISKFREMAAAGDTEAQQVVTAFDNMKTGVGTSTGETVAAIDTLGPAGTAARTTLAYELVALEFLIDNLAQETKQSAIEISTAFSNMATNTHSSNEIMASGFIILIAATTAFARSSQSMASTVSGSFSNMATNTRASMNTMASGFIIILNAFTAAGRNAQAMNSQVSAAFSAMGSKASGFASSFKGAMNSVTNDANRAAGAVKQLQRAIDSLRSKTVTITQRFVTTGQRYVAHGGSFITDSPTAIGPLKASEFGQKELVTVTPLQGPGRQNLPAMSSLTGEETKKKGRRAMDREAESTAQAPKKETVMMRELPIVIQIDGREITRVVNRRIFEGSDALT